MTVPAALAIRAAACAARLVHHDRRCRLRRRFRRRFFPRRLDPLRYAASARRQPARDHEPERGEAERRTETGGVKDPQRQREREDGEPVDGRRGRPFAQRGDAKTAVGGERQPQRRIGGLRLWRRRRGLDRFGRARRRPRLARLGKQLDELGDDRLGGQPDRVRIGTDVGAAEDAERKMRDVAGFQRREQRTFDLGRLGDRFERDAATLAMGLQAQSERLVFGGH
jgi:hypothetical protein